MAMCVLEKTLENAARSSGHNRDLLYALSMLRSCLTPESKEKSEYNLKTLAAADRIKVSLLDHTQRYRTASPKLVANLWYDRGRVVGQLLALEANASQGPSRDVPFLRLYHRLIFISCEECL
mmetsp:Transcript_19028/g.76439  ORF Transcript_19028/g.76439 Transcript_19028/m.76439 type:complete len:122 (-) Transcript_19028:3614-3979(-)